MMKWLKQLFCFHAEWEEEDRSWSGFGEMTITLICKECGKVKQ